jgi:hypothetical protein
METNACRKEKEDWRMIKAMSRVLLPAALLVFLSGAGLAQTAKPEQPPKGEQPKSEQMKPGEMKHEEMKPGEMKHEHPQPGQTKPEHPKSEHPKSEHPK